MTSRQIILFTWRLSYCRDHGAQEENSCVILVTPLADYASGIGNGTPVTYPWLPKVAWAVSSPVAAPLCSNPNILKT